MDSPAGRRIGFLAPMKPELRPLVQMLSLQRDEGDGPPVYRRTIDDTVRGRDLDVDRHEGRRRRPPSDCCATTTSIMWSSSGIAGGVPPTTKLGDVLVPEVVVDAATGQRVPASPLGDTVAGRARPHVGRPRRAASPTCWPRASPPATWRPPRSPPSARTRASRGPPSAPSATSSADRSTSRCWALANPDGTGNMWAAAKYLAPPPVEDPRPREAGPRHQRRHQGRRRRRHRGLRPSPD